MYRSNWISFFKHSFRSHVLNCYPSSAPHNLKAYIHKQLCVHAFTYLHLKSTSGYSETFAGCQYFSTFLFYSGITIKLLFTITLTWTTMVSPCPPFHSRRNKSIDLSGALLVCSFRATWWFFTTKKQCFEYKRFADEPVWKRCTQTILSYNTYL